MLVTMTALAVIVFVDPPEGKEPPTKEELAAITDRGRDLAGYDAAAWHASDALQAKQPKEGSVVRYIAHKSDKKWHVAFGRLDEKQGKFLIAYEATQGDKPDAFEREGDNPTERRHGVLPLGGESDRHIPQGLRGTLRGRAASLQCCRSPRRERTPLGLSLSRTYKAEHLAAGWGCPLPDLRKWEQGDREATDCTRRSSRMSRPSKKATSKWQASILTYFPIRPEDTDVFYVLTRKPNVPELISTERFLFAVEKDGSIELQRKAEEVFKKK